MGRPQATARAIAVARGDEPADLLLTGGRVFVPDARMGRHGARDRRRHRRRLGRRDALEVIDVGGAALTPGFVDTHMHLESTKLWVDEFVRAVLPHGTTAVAADPHEIANVFGVPGVAALAEAAAALPFTFGVSRLELRAGVAVRAPGRRARRGRLRSCSSATARSAWPRS